MKGVFILLTVVCTACATPSCPQENPTGEDVLLSAEDCQHFYKCDHGKAHLMACPTNEEWSQELQRCDWPEVAHCSQSSSGTSPAPTTSTPKPTTPAYVNCPSENPVGEDVLLPAADCQHFYKCDHGIPYLIPCPPNQEWSQELKRCDWPEIAQCSTSNVTNPTSPTSEGTSPTSPTQTTSTSKPTTPPYVSCPQENPIGEDVLLPAKDCQHFYKCDHGVAYLLPCPRNQEWSQELKRCDWPEIAQCTGLSSTEPKPTSSGDTSSTPSSSTSKPTPPPNVSCPPETPEGEDVLLPAEDCQHFYKCDNGEANLQECPENLEWNDELKQCDWPENAKCKPSSNTTPSTPPSSTDTSAATTPTSKPTTPKNPSNICPPDNGEFETILPIPGVCDKFYKCAFGVANIENCPDGTQFSHTMLRCDFPDYAKCTEGVTGIDN